MTRISSKKYLAGSKGQQCTLRIQGVCNENPETVVPAHIRDNHTGRSIKASDTSVANACSACHAVFDGQALQYGHTLSREDWLFYALRGLQETLEQRHEAGLLIIPLDAPKTSTVKPRKPKAERKPVVSRKTEWPSRPFPKRIKP